jgi:hypothetical protein
MFNIKILIISKQLNNFKDKQTSNIILKHSERSHNNPSFVKIVPLAWLSFASNKA